MANVDQGGSAFPVGGHRDSQFYPDPGMSLRDYFAGQALAGILAGGFADTIPHDNLGGGAEAADFAYAYADSMIAARKRGQP